MRSLQGIIPFTPRGWRKQFLLKQILDSAEIDGRIDDYEKKILEMAE